MNTENNAPATRKLSGLLVSLAVGDVYFTSDNAFQKFWKAQSEEVKRNLSVAPANDANREACNESSEPVSSTALASTTKNRGS